ncbi:MAG: CsgG/HfaB family protein [Puniceicoccaceae bacterium]
MKPLLHSICLSLAFLPVLLSARPTIGVSDFGTQYGRTLHRVVPNIITENLINSGQFDFYEREKLGTLLQEQGFQSSGMVDPATAVTLGRLSGIDYILTGEIVDFGREVRNFSGYGVRTQTVDYRLEVAVRVIETETGRVVFSKTEMAEERQNQGSTRVLDTTMDARLGRMVADQLSQDLLSSPVFKAPEEKSAPESAVISITSEPANASVEIDGVFYGNAGGSFELPAGLHQIRISLPGYAVWDKKVMVRDGSSFHVPLVRTSDIRVEVEENTSISTSSAP